MRKFVATSLLGTTIAGILSACGGGDGGYGYAPPPAPTLDSYLGTTGVFVAWADDVSGTLSAATVGSYAGKKQSLRGTIDFTTGQSLGQLAGVEIYKGADGFIHETDLTSTSTPVGTTSLERDRRHDRRHLHAVGDGRRGRQLRLRRRVLHGRFGHADQFLVHLPPAGS